MKLTALQCFGRILIQINAYKILSNIFYIHIKKLLALKACGYLTAFSEDTQIITVYGWDTILCRICSRTLWLKDTGQYNTGQRPSVSARLISVHSGFVWNLHHWRILNEPCEQQTDGGRVTCSEDSRPCTTPDQIWVFFWADINILDILQIQYKKCLDFKNA